MPIPKTIHIIWIGDETKRPDVWIKTWKAMNPGYEVRVWGNDAVRAESWMLGDRINAWLGREINGAADIIRWEILFRYGGLAFDADSACVRPLEDWLIEPNCFAAWENEILRPGLIAAGAMGFTPNHALVGCILQDILTDPDPFNGMAWQKLGPQRITDTVRRLNFANLTVYPSHFFFPRHYSGLEYSGSGPIFARQYWGSTHRGWGVENPAGTGTEANEETPASAAALQPPTAVLPAPQPAAVIPPPQPAAMIPPPQPAVTILPPQPAAVRAEPATSSKDRPRAGALIQRGWGDNFYLQKMTVSDIPERLPLMRALCTGKSVLHVGCTDYPVFDPQRNLHIQIKDVCARLDGLDTDVDGMAVLSRYVDGRYYKTVDEVEGSYDMLLVPETIEHVSDIAVFLNSLDRISFKEVMITAPCLIGWRDCFNYEDYRGRRFDQLSGSKDYIEEIHPDHKAWFTPYTLSNCVEQFTPWRIQNVMFLEDKRMTAVICAKTVNQVPPPAAGLSLGAADRSPSHPGPHRLPRSGARRHAVGSA